MAEADCQNQIISQSYADFIIEFGGNVGNIKERYEVECVQVISPTYAVIHTPISFMADFDSFAYNSVPKLYGLMDTTSMDNSGITRIHTRANLELKGRDILVGIIDTGIDYTHPVFRYADGTTRITAIWDQSIQSPEQERFPASIGYGTEYTSEDINRALASDSPYDIVPSRDEQGHGTFMAGIAAGNTDPANDFTGAAPEASIAVVKLKQAKNYLKAYQLITQETLAYQENDIMMGIRYLIDLARHEGKPLVICLGLGTNAGGRSGSSYLADYIDTVGNLAGVCIVCAVGNEGNRASHFRGNIPGREGSLDVEIRVDSGEEGFILELWGSAPDIFSIGIISPGGERIEQIQPRLGQMQTINFVFEPTEIFVYYELVESSSGNQVIIMRFQLPSAGIWTVRVFGRDLLYGIFNMWLPIAPFIRAGTYFLKPEPNTTITSPSDANVCIAVTAYNHYNGSIYVEAGRGYTSDGRIAPDIAAPGVNVYGPVQGGRFSTRSGTSIAAAHVAGAAALLLQWGIYKRNNLNMDTTEINRYLIRGAIRQPSIVYPNMIWGFGTLDLNNVFQLLAT